MKIKTAAFALGFLTLGAFDAHQAQAQAAPFLDTPTNHWAYESVQDLAKRGIVIGYPDGTYGGKRPMTRYEFAVAIDRALRTMDDMVKAQQGVTPPPGTPPPTELTQDQLNEVQALIDKFRPELTTIESDLKTAQDNIDALRADVLDAKALANKAQATADNSYGVGANRKFQISGYIQARFQEVPSGQGSQQRFPQGVPGGAGSYNGNYAQGFNQDSFELRRSRLKITGAVTDNTKYGIQLDASGATTTTNQQVTVREGYVAYTFGGGDSKRYPTLTAGQFATPFGYALPASMSNFTSPERPLAFSEASYGIFATQDYDKGVQFSYNLGQKLLFIPSGLKLSVAAVNGSGRDSEATDRFVNTIYRASYQTTNKVLGVGVSYYDGQISTSAIPSNLGAGTTSVNGLGPSYTGRRKELFGADAQLTLPVGIFVNAEYVGGLYEQRSFFTPTPSAASVTNPSNSFSSFTTISTAYARDNKIDGGYVQGGYTFGQTGAHPLTLAADYDLLKRGEGPGGSSAYTDENVGYGALYNLDKATRLRVWYDRPDKVAHTPGTASPPKYGLVTGEVQVKF